MTKRSGDEIPENSPNKQPPGQTVPGTEPGSDNPVNPQDDE